MAKNSTTLIVRYLNKLSKTHANEIIKVLDVKNKTDKKLIISIMTTAVFKAVNDSFEFTHGR
jgi:hypothetical protein